MHELFWSDKRFQKISSFFEAVEKNPSLCEILDDLHASNHPRLNPFQTLHGITQAMGSLRQYMVLLNFKKALQKQSPVSSRQKSIEQEEKRFREHFDLYLVCLQTHEQDFKKIYEDYYKKRNGGEVIGGCGRSTKIIPKNMPEYTPQRFREKLAGLLEKDLWHDAYFNLQPAQTICDHLLQMYHARVQNEIGELRSFAFNFLANELDKKKIQEFSQKMEYREKHRKHFQDYYPECELARISLRAKFILNPPRLVPRPPVLLLAEPSSLSSDKQNTSEEKTP